MTALTIMRLLPQPAGFVDSGRVVFMGRNLLELPEEEMQKLRGREISMIFQEPMTSLNPVFTVGYQIAEVFVVHGVCSWKEGMERAVELLRKVRVPDPEKRIKEYPHQLSGGMRQRVMIAMALALNPKLLIADEPTTALDVTVQAQILELMGELKEQYGMSVLLITHDLGVVAELAHHVAIMYLGKIVEEASVEELFDRPMHPYTRGLLESLPPLEGEKRILKPIPGMVPDLASIPQGCPFYDRCEVRMNPCREDFPEYTRVSDTHRVACYYAQKEIAG